MLVSKWVESEFTKGVWRSENCVEGTVKIVEGQEGFRYTLQGSGLVDSGELLEHRMFRYIMIVMMKTLQRSNGCVGFADA